MSKNKNNNSNIPTTDETTTETQTTINQSPPDTFNKYSVNIIAKKLNVRSGPSMEHKVVGILEASTKKYQILEEKDGFGRIEKNRWIMLEHTAET